MDLDLPYPPHHCKGLNGLICADVLLRNYSLTQSRYGDAGLIVPEFFFNLTLKYVHCDEFWRAKDNSQVTVVSGPRTVYHLQYD